MLDPAYMQVLKKKAAVKVVYLYDQFVRGD
jgi:hypothetical protein